MKNFTIKVTEHREGLVVVEGKDENDALERLGRIIESDAFWNDFEICGEYPSKLRSSPTAAAMTRLPSGTTKATATYSVHSSATQGNWQRSPFFVPISLSDLVFLTIFPYTIFN